MDASIDFCELGFIRVAASAPALALADPLANAERMLARADLLAERRAALVLFPELSLTGYSCEDLFFSAGLHQSVRRALVELTRATASRSVTLVVGCPWQTRDGRLLNTAVVIARGRVQGVVPKIHLPNHDEFYERRWFASGAGVEEEVADPVLGTFRVTANQLFNIGQTRFGIELCEDLWAPEPPGIRLCLAGADLILNPSASNELVAKSDYRRDLVRMTSARGLCGYLYAGSGPLESTKDVVFGGHLLAAENGQLLGESNRFEFAGSSLVLEFDIERLRHDRLRNTTFAAVPRGTSLPLVECAPRPATIDGLLRGVDAHPFVPGDEGEFEARAAEILAIQSTGLARRMLSAGSARLVIGLSGGLDSTLAFLVCLDALTKLGRPLSDLSPLTLPGPGTSERTLESARALCQAAGVALKEIPIHAAVTQHLSDLGHTTRNDIVFENAQARERTQLLFNHANQVSGLLVGTGDLSELALGWCTFNADHMASYNVNASVPKTMMAYLVRWYARHRATPALASVLERVLATPISPELLEPSAERALQATEEIVGPYELHDFFLYHFMRNGSSPRRIFALAVVAFAPRYSPATIRRWLREFCQRFFTQQFKRTTLPPGPKVGSVSLSPRGDWRMPDEVAVASILAEIDALPIDLPAPRQDHSALASV
ncbi:MAG: NAD(+) synthase [Pseudomonadales bacterium]